MLSMLRLTNLIRSDLAKSGLEGDCLSVSGDARISGVHFERIWVFHDFIFSKNRLQSY